jgi:hypothetical protein
MAAALEGCVNCAAKTPYTACVSGHCFDNSNNTFHPQAAVPINGVIDMALNSLDGDRSGDAEGPVAFYNENTAAGNGDNFTWSFFISDKLDLTPPGITITFPAHNSGNVSLADPIYASFNKVMMSSSLGTGSIKVNNGKKEIEHKLINLWNLANQANGYWVKSENIDNAPADGEPDWTKAGIYHSLFYDTTSYRAQIGSGVNDIYQNCYNPSSGVTCTGNPSCCGLAPTAAGSCP